MDRVPTEAEINVHDSLDERWAVEHMLGRTRAEAQAQFEGNIGHWGESLMHIGPVACAYYGLAAIDAAWSCARKGDRGEALHYILMVWKHRFESWGWDVGAQPGFTEAVRALCGRVEAEYDTLGIDEAWYPGIRSGYRDLHEKLGGPRVTSETAPRLVAPHLPSASDINVTDSFDEREAVRAFLGLELPEAEARFVADANRMGTLLAEMGPAGFAYYLPAAIAAVRSPATRGVVDTPARELLFCIRQRAHRHWQLHQMHPLAVDAGIRQRLPDLLELCRAVETQPRSSAPRGPEAPTSEEEPNYDAMFRRELEAVRDRRPRPALLADGSLPPVQTNASSVDAMVFDPDHAPAGRTEFVAWYADVTAWRESHGYDDPSICGPRLQAWMRDMVIEIAPLCGPWARPGPDVTHCADFCCDRSFVYFTASPHDPAPVWGRAGQLAARHELGLFLVASERGEVYHPDGKGGLTLQHTRAPEPRDALGT